MKPLIPSDEITKIIRFGTVGLAATIAHVATVLILVELSGLGPLTANLFAFGLAVLVSFWGNYHWTFKASNSYTSAFPRFFAIALLGLALNQTIMFGAVSILTLDYRLGLAAAIILIPAMSFLANKFWAFQTGKNC